MGCNYLSLPLISASTFLIRYIINIGHNKFITFISLFSVSQSRHQEDNISKFHITTIGALKSPACLTAKRLVMWKDISGCVHPFITMHTCTEAHRCLLGIHKQLTWRHFCHVISTLLIPRNLFSHFEWHHLVNNWCSEIIDRDTL